MTTKTLSVFYGTIIHSQSLTELEIVENGLLIVDRTSGVIQRLERNVSNPEEALKDLDASSYELHKMSPHQFLLPGFIDTHAHAPQYVFAGSGMELQLLDWLNANVFPVESSFASTEMARKSYTKVVSRFLRNGTTTCSWFATIHLEACKVLVDIIRELGQRAYVGKVNMDQNSPDFYVEKTQESLDATRAFIEYTLPHGPLVTPVVTPRFAITCSSTLMKGLSALASEYKVPIQTHLCENHNEINFTCSLFPDSKHYTGIYHDHGLFTASENVYMAHCVHMDDDEIQLLKENNVGISHCANSNFSLQSGVCDVRRFLESGVKVGLGTDVAGGYAPSMLDAVRSSFFASKVQLMRHRDELNKPDYKVLGTTELVYLATMGGARVLGLQDTIGNFEQGKAFDALFVDLNLANSPVDVMGHENKTQLLEKFLFNGSDQSLAHVFVQGRRVAGAASVPL